MSKPLPIIIGAVAGAALVGVLAWLSLRNPVKPPVPHDDPAMRMSTTGVSMLGYYQTRHGLIPVKADAFDVLVDTTFPFADLKPQDNVIFRNRFRSMWINHIVVAWNAEHTAIRTAGSGNVSSDDGWTLEKDYVGKVVAVETAHGMQRLRE